MKLKLLTILNLIIGAMFLGGCGQYERSKLGTTTTTPKSESDKTLTQGLKDFESTAVKLAPDFNPNGPMANLEAQALAQMLLELQGKLRSQLGQAPLKLPIEQKVSQITSQIPVFQFVDTRIGARAYAAAASFDQLKAAVSLMAGNHFYLEGLSFFLPASSSACNIKLYQYVYSDPAVGYLYAYLTRDPKGERGTGEPASYRVNWSPNGFGYVCNEMKPGLVPLYRLTTRNGQIAGTPYIGVVTARKSAVTNLVGQRWTNNGIIGYVLPPL